MIVFKSDEFIRQLMKFLIEGYFMKLSHAIFSNVCFMMLSLQNAFALTNSTPAISPSYDSVMFITSEAPNSKGDTTPSHCNATLIHRNVLVTAAHCAILGYISGVKKIDIQVGYYKYVTRPSDGQVVRVGYAVKSKLSKVVHIELPRSVEERIPRKGENSIGPDDDVALVWWDDEIPEFSSLPLAQMVSPREHASLIKNLAATSLMAVTINPFSEMSSDTKRMAILNNKKWYQSYVYSKSLSRVEEGDSGSPLFVDVNGQPKILAVVKGRASTAFDNWDVYSAVTPHVCQMASSLPTFIKLESCVSNY
jgi:hypothetical protein